MTPPTPPPAPAATLFDRASALAAVHEWLAEPENVEAIIAAEGVIPPGLADVLAQMEGSFAEKAARVIHVIRELAAQAETIQQEIARLSARRTARERAAERLKNYLHDCMIEAGTTRVETPFVTARIQLTPPKVEVAVDPAVLPPRFVRVVPERHEPNKLELLHAHRAGEVLPDGVTVTRGSTLILR